MPLFHTHLFFETANPLIYMCRCGETKNIHQHIWTEHRPIKQKRNLRIDTDEMITGIILKCKECGELKEFSL